MECSDTNVGTVVGRGESGRISRAIRRAVDDFFDEGMRACAGGNCLGRSAKCEFLATSITVTWSTGGADGAFGARAEGTGTCACA